MSQLARVTILFILVLGLIALEAPASKSEKAPAYKTQVKKVTDEIIWAMEELPDQTLLFSERSGGIRIWNPKTQAVVRVGQAPDVYEKDQAGLLDLKLHPQFKENAWVYVTQSIEKNGQNTTRLSRFQLKNNSIHNWENLLVTDAWSKNNQHYGSRLAFDKSGFLFMTVGERNERHEAQKLSNHKGKLLRLTELGKPAPGNPFEKNKDAKPEIYSYGHRNPQGLAIDKEGQIWVGEHGPRGGDEINLAQPGKNYGWPVITYGKEYWGPGIGPEKKEGMEQPVHRYTPSIAPSGFVIYSGPMFPEWKGEFFQGALAKTHLNKVKIEGSSFKQESRLLESMNERVRDVEQSADGKIYVSTDSGKIISIER